MVSGSMQANPMGAVERCFGVLCLVSGLLSFGGAVSLLSCKITQVKRAKAAIKREFRMLCQFLRQAQVRPSWQ